MAGSPFADGFSYEKLVKIIRVAVYYQRCTNSVNVASLAIVLADYLQTLPDEVALLWPKEWNLVKCLFVLSRYLPFIYAPITIWVGLQAEGATLGACAVGFGASTLLIGLSMLIAEAIMFVRLYALSGRSKMMLAWICVQLIAVLATILPGLSFFVKSIKFMKSPLRNVTGCLPNRFEEELLLLVYATVGASQMVMMLLTSWVAWKNYKGSGSPILATFYRDGLLYFLCLTLVTVGNIIFDRVGPPESGFMLTLPQGILHSIMSCRLILHIHQVSFRELNGTSKYPKFSGIEFAKPSNPPSGKITHSSESTWTERTIGQTTTSNGDNTHISGSRNPSQASTVIQFKPVSKIVTTLAGTLANPSREPNVEKPRV